MQLTKKSRLLLIKSINLKISINQINQNQTNDQVDTTTNQAVNAIDNVEAEVVIKPKAIADIEKAVKEKQQQI